MRTFIPNTLHHHARFILLAILTIIPLTAAYVTQRGGGKAYV